MFFFTFTFCSSLIGGFVAAKAGATQAEKDDEIEQVAGNAEDDIGELIKHVREDELLYGERSLLKVYGPLLVYVCGSPQIYKVRFRFPFCG